MRRLQSVIIGAAVAIAASTSAAPATAAMITDWTVTFSNNWTNTSFASSGPGSVNPTDAFGVFDTLPDGSDPRGASYDVIRWGTPATDAGRSFLAVDDTLTVGGLRTNDTAGVAGTSFYHGNFSQRTSSANNPAERWLDRTTLLSSITITPASGSDEGGTSVSRSFPIDFFETVNSTDLANCPGAPWDAGTTGCPDRFTSMFSEASFSFLFDGFRYVVSVIFDPENSENLARLDGEPGGPATIWTNENVRSRLATRIVISAEEVPEPAAIGLLGAGIAMLGMMRRRRA